MKRIKILSGIIIFIVIIVSILLYNRSKLKSAAQNLKISEYPVVVEKVKTKVLNKPYILVGNTSGYQDIMVVSESEGKVTRVNTNVGDYIKRGEVIIELDNELEKALFEAAKINYDKSNNDFKRFTVLHKSNSVSDTQYEGIKLAAENAKAKYISAKKNYYNTFIVTPISGVVTMRNIEVGDYVKKRNIIANVVNLLKLKIDINVAEKIVFNLKKGEKVKITTDIFPSKIFYGFINTISQKGDLAHTYPVQVVLKNDGNYKLKAGMFAKVQFEKNSNYSSLVIPRKALLGSIKQAKVFVVNNGRVKLRNIKIGESFEEYLQVLQGLNEGEVIVINGQNNLKDNYPVKIIEGK